MAGDTTIGSTLVPLKTPKSEASSPAAAKTGEKRPASVDEAMKALEGANAGAGPLVEGGYSKRADKKAVEPSLLNPGNRFFGPGEGATDDQYFETGGVQQILAGSCATCHQCSTSPCQLKLTESGGVQRGANAYNIFTELFKSDKGSTIRIKDTEGKSREELDKLGFYSVLKGGENSEMYKLIEAGLKQNEPGFDLTAAWNLYQKGPRDLKFDALMNDPKKIAERLSHFGLGMPFGTTMRKQDAMKLLEWIKAGAPGPTKEAQEVIATPRDPKIVAEWETFFNQSTPKGKLAMRYLFEHMGFAKIHFDESKDGRGDFFEMVRSSTPPGQPIKEIVTDINSDDPKGEFYYRLKKHTGIIAAKDTTVFHLTGDVKKHWDELFLKSNWNVSKVPSYASGNPFENFDQIPAKIRYQFMMENSHHMINAMVQADVCTGGTATYAIRDRFGVVFLKPDADPTAIDPKLGGKAYDHLDPAATSLDGPGMDRLYSQRFEQKMKELRPNGITIDDIWDGSNLSDPNDKSRSDKNAFITVFRHNTNASSHQGPIGQFPETMALVDYANFERLFYDLVVNYKPWEGPVHKTGTWTTMSLIRGKWENTFRFLAPEQMRKDLYDETTKGFGALTETPMLGKGLPTGLKDIDPKKPMQSIVSQLRKHLGPTVAPETILDPDPMKPVDASVPDQVTDRDSLEKALHALTLKRGGYSSAIPETTWITVKDDKGNDLDYTVLVNRVYKSNSRLVGYFANDIPIPLLNNHLPDQDSLSVVRGHIGAFPELIMELPMRDVSGVVKDATRGELKTVRNKYELKRNSTAFAEYIEREHKKRVNDLDSGIVDISRMSFPPEAQFEK